MRIVNAKHRLLVETLLIFASCEAILMWLLPRFLPDLQSGLAATSDVTLLTLTAGALLWWRFNRHYEIAETRRRAEAEQWAADLRRANTTQQSEADERERAQAFLRAVVENLPIPVFIKEARELRFVLWNRAGEELTGIPSAEMIGKSDHDFFPPADAALYVARDRAALTSRGVLETAEETIQTRHHGARITHVWKVPIVDAAGQPTHLLGISEDITERKRIAVTLQQSEERFRLVVEQSPDVIGIYQDTRLVFINATGVRLLGAQTPAELLGRKSEQMVHPDDFPDMKDRIQRRLAGETGLYPAEVRYLRLDGTPLLMEVSAAPITYEGQPAVQFIARDIGDRKRSEEQLRVQASALDAAANAIVITDQRGTIQSVNAAFTTLTGYTAAEAVGQNPRLLSSGQQDAAFFRNLWQTISSGQIWSGEVTNRRKDGSLYVEEMMITPLRNGAGGIVRYIAIKQDITERKRAEAALQESADLATLEAEVGTAITQAGSLGEMLQRCSEAVVVHLDGAFTRVWILNEAAQMLELQASAGCYTHLDGPHGRVPVGQFKIGRIAQERKAYLTNQVVGDPRVADQAWAQREGMVAFAGYPLMLADRVIGVAAIFARHPLEDATLQALAVIANTIAVGIERKQAEAALRESRQILEGILNAIPVRVFWKDRNLVYLGCNAIFARDAGFTDHHDIIGKDDYQLGWREQAELYRTSDREIIVSGRPQLFIEEPQTTQDGKLITLLTSKLPLRSATGEICGVLGTYVDITERKQAEEALHQRVKLQEQLVHLAATVPGMIYSLRLRPDGSTQLPFASRVLSDIFELQPEDVLEDAAAIFALVHPDDIGHLQGTMNESARTLTPWRDDFRVCRRRRGEIWVEGHSVPKREPDGSILWQGYVQNITERKLAEATLQESERLLQSTLDALSAHLAILDAHGTIIKVNAAWNRFATANQFQGDHHGVGDNYLTVCESVVGRDSIEAPAVAAGIRALLAGQRERIQLEYACHSPREQRWFLLRANRFAGDGPVRVVVAHEDVTVRRHAENLVRQSEERYRSLINTARDGIFTLAADGTFRSMNPAIESIAGISAADWIGKPFAPLIHPDDLPLALERFQRILSGQPAPIYELRIHPSRERPVVMEFMLAPQADEGGQVIGVLGIGREITERKQAQADLERVHRQLQEASRLGGMAEIATNVLHNVGNVLNSVNVSTSLLVESVQQSRAANLGRVVGLLQAHAPDLAAFITEDPKGKQLPAYLAQLATHLMADQTAMTRELDSLRRNVEHIKEIVAMQQNYATFGGVKEMINLVDLIEDSLRINTGALNRHRVRIIREFAPVPPLNVEKHKILQILVNLLRNAKHACQESDRADRQLTVRLVQTAGRIQISVTDNGVGIPPENLSRIFSHGFTTRKNGHGFGLHSGALAAQEIGGSLTAHSAGPGHGATFTLDLPGPADADHAP